MKTSTIIRVKLEHYLYRILLIAALLSPLFANRVEGQTKQESPWKEVQVVEIPSGQTLYEGVTKNGNPKFWFEFGDIKVNVSPGSAAKYKDNTTTLLLVKWQHQESGKIKYSTRQKSQSVTKTVDVDLTKLF